MSRMLWGAPTLQFHHCTLSFKNISHKTNNTPNRKYSTFSLHASHPLAPKQPPTTAYYMYLLRQNMRNWQQIEQQYVNIHKTNNIPNILYLFSPCKPPACSQTTTHHIILQFKGIQKQILLTLYQSQCLPTERRR